QEVTVAYSGHDGVQAAEQYQPDVVLCDIGLPGLDGYGVARKLRDNPATATARLIAVTAYGQDEDRRRSHEAGFEQHLVKPVDPDGLESLVNSGDRPSKARDSLPGGGRLLGGSATHLFENGPCPSMNGWPSGQKRRVTLSGTETFGRFCME